MTPDAEKAARDLAENRKTFLLAIEWEDKIDDVPDWVVEEIRLAHLAGQAHERERLLKLAELNKTMMGDHAYGWVKILTNTKEGQE